MRSGTERRLVRLFPSRFSYIGKEVNEMGLALLPFSIAFLCIWAVIDVFSR